MRDAMQSADPATSAWKHRVAEFAASEMFDRLFKEGMALVEEAATYLDGPGRTDSRKLNRELALVYAAESMEVTTRLMQAASWLVVQRAVRESDMKVDEAGDEKYRIAKPGEPHPCDVHLGAEVVSILAAAERYLARSDEVRGERPTA